ncbi:MAG: DUF1730 domain-containing protein [Clostridia bacterium]|nr:DUF1730 domain-containing protein [Clostridia bacterium]
MKNLSNFILNLGIDRFGFCKAGDFYAVVMLFPYYSGKVDDSNISVYTYSEDYHIIIKRYLEKVADFIKLAGKFNTQIYVDVSPYNDIELGFKAGLGVIGKNGLLINDKYGTFHFIGYVVTDMPLSESVPLKGECLNCNKCIKNCPAGALKDKDFTKCLSEVTQKKGKLSDDEIKLIKENGSSFGCDICQNVCPMNKFNITPIEDFKVNLVTKIKSSDFEGLSNKEFKQKYQNRAFSWRGKNVLLRNLDILDS